jgi:hypothetical protein
MLYFNFDDCEQLTDAELETRDLINELIQSGICLDFFDKYCIMDYEKEILRKIWDIVLNYLLTDLSMQVMTNGLEIDANKKVIKVLEATGLNQKFKLKIANNYRENTFDGMWCYED